MEGSVRSAGRDLWEDLVSATGGVRGGVQSGVLWCFLVAGTCLKGFWLGFRWVLEGF